MPRRKRLASACKGSPLLRLLTFLALAFGCSQQQTTITRLDDARALAADLRVQFNKSADATNRAVMADTDEASLVFAKEAETAGRAVDSDMARLAPLLQSLKISEEARDLDDFRTHLFEYRKLERRILALAVENTNLKAQALSFGGARAAADAFRDALSSAAAGFASKDRCQVSELTAQAVTAVREIQVLHAPHIAERDDASMTRMEKEMAVLDTVARAALKALDELAPSSVAPSLAEAHAGLERFEAISAQIVELSRRNTNVVSLDLALRKKPALTTACDERLGALQALLAKEGSKATR